MSMIYDEKYETMDRGDLRQLQLERLQSVLLRAERNVAFYRRAFGERGVRTDRIASLADLAELPFTTKADLRESYPYGMFAVPLRDIVRIQTTSGTTGRPVVVGYTRNDIRNWSLCMARLLAAGGVSDQDVVQIAFTYGLFSGGFGFHYGAERIGASVIPASSVSVDRQLSVMKDFKTTVLACTPGLALAMADALPESGIGRVDLALKAGFFGAEPWSESLRRDLERKLGIAALDVYGLTEIVGPGVAGECAERSGLHVNEDQFIPEIVDPATLRPAAPGAEGELVLTTIAKEGFPLIRYRTGDLTSLDESPCACGRTTARMKRVANRLDDMITLGDVKVFPSQVEEALLGAQGVEPHYQIVIDRAGGMDTMEIRVEVSETLPGLDETRILQRIGDTAARRIEAAIGLRPKVTLVEPRSIARAEDGKRLPVIDRRER
jgi:phenylacetate-CoA ligase